jgi:hypothetical protein
MEFIMLPPNAKVSVLYFIELAQILGYFHSFDQRRIHDLLNLPRDAREL